MGEPTTEQSPTENTAAARREARRRKILENSGSRMGLITGRPVEDMPKDAPQSPPTTYADPDIEWDMYDQLPTTLTTPHNTPIVPNMPNLPFSGDAEMFEQLFRSQLGNGGFASFAGGPQASHNVPKTPEHSVVKFVNTRLHIVLIAFVTYALFAANVSHIVMNNVFLLLLMGELLETLVMRRIALPNAGGGAAGMFSLVLMLCGVTSRQHSEMLFSVFRTASKILNDTAVFVFSFVCVHLCWLKFGAEAISESMVSDEFEL